MLLRHLSCEKLEEKSSIELLKYSSDWFNDNVDLRKVLSNASSKINEEN